MYLDIHQDIPVARRCQCTGMMEELELRLTIMGIEQETAGDIFGDIL